MTVHGACWIGGVRNSKGGRQSSLSQGGGGGRSEDPLPGERDRSAYHYVCQLQRTARLLQSRWRRRRRGGEGGERKLGSKMSASKKEGRKVGAGEIRGGTGSARASLGRNTCEASVPKERNKRHAA